MEANIRQGMPPVALPDLAGSQDRRDFLTRSNSENESALTVEDLKNTFRRTEDSTSDKCTTWTDEKHSIYLHHLESSFVEQLHHSLGLSRRCSELETEGTSVSRKQSANKQHASEQLTVLPDGSWKKIELKSNRPILKIAAESLVLKNPWIQHLGCADKSRIIKSAHSQEYNPVPTGGKRLGGKRIFSNESATRLEQIPASLRIHNGSVDCTEEFSDQNFADEEVLEEKSRIFVSKRSKSSVADASSQDQIVPLGKSHMAGSSLSSWPYFIKS